MEIKITENGIKILDDVCWICGHWRTYRSEKWKSMQGKIIWIAPFMKGQGVLIKNSYRVIPEETDDVLDYEEIK